MVVSPLWKIVNQLTIPSIGENATCLKAPSTSCWLLFRDASWSTDFVACSCDWKHKHTSAARLDIMISEQTGGTFETLKWSEVATVRIFTSTSGELTSWNLERTGWSIGVFTLDASNQEHRWWTITGYDHRADNDSISHHITSPRTYSILVGKDPSHFGSACDNYLTSPFTAYTQ